jgi:hypothetical protein
VQIGATPVLASLSGAAAWRRRDCARHLIQEMICVIEQKLIQNKNASHIYAGGFTAAQHMGLSAGDISVAILEAAIPSLHHALHDFAFVTLTRKTLVSRL